MTSKKQNADFLHVGEDLLAWYRIYGRDLPFRQTRDPYKIWICEIVFQQTRIEQGIQHYNNFVKRFPDAYTLAQATVDEVLLYWKGLGYYSRAINVHKAANQIVNDYKGKFPTHYEDIISLKGVGKYTAAAIASICFGAHLPAVDGNFYRVLSRFFGDDFDISNFKAFDYFSDLAYRMMPVGDAGTYNEAMMDLGSEICKPKNPLCLDCPLNKICVAFQTGRVHDFPVKSKKTKATNLILSYYYIHHEDQFLIKQRADDFIWKKLFDFPELLPEKYSSHIVSEKIISHKLTHKNLTIHIYKTSVPNLIMLQKLASELNCGIICLEDSHFKSFPKPLENYLNNL